MKKRKKKHIKERLKEHRWDIKTWARLESELLYSEAFNSLSAITMRVLIRFLQKRPFDKKSKRSKGMPTYYNKNLTFTYSEAAAFGISPKSFARAIQDLVRKGFLKVDHQGGSFKGYDTSSYSLIEDWRDYGNDCFKPREKKPAVQYSESLKEFNRSRRKQKQGNPNKEDKLSDNTKHEDNREYPFDTLDEALMYYDKQQAV